ncbi:hypothetical protein, partial [Bradyrhizobium canariense]|uniref:hypothetical protein n=1 Tax=Bradyrhizobium canariense TaxID=255045 RepID=UPI001A7E0CCB
MSDEMEEIKIETACHEAGHAVMGCLLERLPISVSIVADVKGAVDKTEFEQDAPPCQSAFDWDPLSASKRDPFDRRALLVALGSSELVGVAETARAR